MMEKHHDCLNGEAHQLKDLLHKEKKKSSSIYFARYNPGLFSARISARDCLDTRTINIASPTVKPFNTLSYKKTTTKHSHHVYVTATAVPRSAKKRRAVRGL